MTHHKLIHKFIFICLGITILALLFNDASNDLSGVSDSFIGGKVVKLLGLSLAFGIIIFFVKEGKCKK